MKPATLAFVAPSPVALPPRPAALVPPRTSYAELARPPRSRRVLLVGIAAAHLLAFWGLSRMQDVKRAISRVTPIVVRV
ncbi:MAG TPA: hypothetical protein VK305_20150, partial [Roseateles sp.]|nr:hypothetical protein [Roseateles sp.]